MQANTNAKNNPGGNVLRSKLLCAALVALAGCATQPAADAAKDTMVANQSKVCDRELTGSHFKRCSREGTTVEVISRDELEMIQTRTNNMPMEPGTKRGR
jgi:hypothetical protein